MSAVFFVETDIAVIEQHHYTILKKLAMESPLRRSRICLHEDRTDPLHEMIIAFCQDSYVAPHRHHQKTESFHLIEGQVMIVTFDDAGAPTYRITLGDPASGKPPIYRLNRKLWHTVIPLTEFVILHETTNGPFVRHETDYAAWGPADGDLPAIAAFLEHAQTAPLVTPRPRVNKPPLQRNA